MLRQEFGDVESRETRVKDRPRSDLTERGPVKMIRMAVCHIEVTRPSHEIEFIDCRILLQPPATPENRPNQPGIRRHKRFTILEQNQCGVCDGLEFVPHDAFCSTLVRTDAVRADGTGSTGRVDNDDTSLVISFE